MVGVFFLFKHQGDLVFQEISRLYRFQVDIYVPMNKKCVLNEGVQVLFEFSIMLSAKHLHVALK